MLLLMLTLSATPATVAQASAAFSKAYDSAFDRLKSVELSDTQTRIEKLGKGGKAFQTELATLRKRQGEVSDLLVKAVELKKQGEAQKKAQPIEEATQVLHDADARAQKLVADVEQLDQRLTAAGAPLLAPRLARDPNARD